MNETDVVHIAGQALMLAAKLAGPLLLAALVVGVVVSLLQAVFQVQDQTLSMVPKLALGGMVLALTGGWMLRITVEFTQQLFERIPDLVR
ncbi:MAG: flagellar type III secretion system protein FliQ [Pseudorhodobacter sp.]|nr:flagellar type III secretion system protein FliQ [Frankiaceae bacterium]